MDIPILLLHGDDDQTGPTADSSLLNEKLLPAPALKIHQGPSHGLDYSSKFGERDLLAFIQAVKVKPRLSYPSLLLGSFGAKEDSQKAHLAVT